MTADPEARAIAAPKKRGRPPGVPLKDRQLLDSTVLKVLRVYREVPYSRAHPGGIVCKVVEAGDE